MAKYNLVVKEPKRGWAYIGMLLTDKEVAAYPRENWGALVETVRVSVPRKDVYWFFGGRCLWEENKDYKKYIG